MSLLQTLTDYRSAVASVNGLITGSHRLDPAGSYLWSIDDRKTITEFAFLKMFIAWEHFLETSFTLYIMGHPSASGTSLARYIFPVDHQHANKILLGTAKYVDWSSPDNVRRLAGLCFAQDNPFEPSLASIHSELLDLKTIRNVAAHLSSTTSSQLDALSTRRLSRNCTSMSVYDLISAIDPNSTTNQTILQVDQGLLDALLTRYRTHRNCEEKHQTCYNDA